jgi:hypothetical protein
MNDPIATQREVLQDLITHAQYTCIGRKYGLNKLFSVKEFKNSIPIHEYEDILPYVDELMKGNEHQLWNTPTSWFAKSSGTTSSKSKFIPITKESLEDCHYKASKDVLSLYYFNYPDSDLLTGKGLVVGGSHQISLVNEEVQFGDLSAVLLQNAPYWGQWLRTPELSIALLDEWEDKIEKLAQNTINENVTSIAGVPTWTLILLKRILEITGKKTIAQVWENLELYIHGGVNFAPYKQQFEQVMGKPINYLEIYNASEGFFAAQDKLDEEGMLLFLEHGIFYEFMPIEEYGKEAPKTVGLNKVQLGKIYAPVITTNGGLWRYLIGDTIEFTKLYPFKIKVVGRVKHFINAFGEELIIDNADKAITIACEKTNCIINDYTAAPKYMDNASTGAHQWVIEFEKDPISIDEFAYELDCALKALNSDYEAKRQKDIALQIPIITPIQKGSFNKWLQQKGKLGGQHKVPRLSNNREFIDEIEELIK